MKPDLHGMARWAPAIVGCLLIATVIGGLAWGVSSIKTYVTQIAERQAQNAPKIDEAKQAAQAAKRGVAILEDCLTPGGKCNEQTRANQSAVLRQVSDLIRWSFLCNDDPDVAGNEQAFRSCVDNYAKENAHANS